VEGLITIADPSGAVAALLDAAMQVQQTEPSSALVGGVAVICRLATAHRATLDADTVVEEREPGVLEVLRARPDTSVPADPDSQGVLIHGALVEIIEVAPVLPADVAAVDDLRDRLFVATHRWALDTADAGRPGHRARVGPATSGDRHPGRARGNQDPRTRGPTGWTSGQDGQRPA
jgi:hypothetical protein